MFIIHASETHFHISLSSFSYDLVNEIKKSLTDRRFSRANDTWIAPINWRTIEELKSIYENHNKELDPEIIKAETSLRKEGDIDWNAIEINYPSSKTMPYTHQVEAVKRLLYSKRSYFLAMDMGTGKTKCIIDAYTQFHNDDSKVKLLIICPKTVIGVWFDEFAKHSAKFGYENILLLTGNRRDRQYKIDEVSQNQNILIINYDGLNVIEKELESFVTDNRVIIVADESTSIKNPQARRSKVLHQIAPKAIRRYALSGTAVTQGYVDLFSQIKFLDPSILSISSFTKFKQRYCIYGGYGNYQLMGYRNTDELKEIIKRYFYRVLKSDCLDLPEKIYQSIKVDLSDIQKHHYDQLKEERATQVQDTILTAPIAITRLLRFQQITSGFLPLGDGEDKYLELESEKYNTLKDMIESIALDNNAKVAIIARFHHDLDRIIKLVESYKLGYIEISGRVNIKERMGIDLRFNEDPNLKVAILQETAAKEGLNLTSINHVIFYSLTFSLNDFLQIQDRFHRIGQKSNVNYYALICRKTVDESLYKILQKKYEPASYLLQYGESGLQDIIHGNVKE